MQTQAAFDGHKSSVGCVGDGRPRHRSRALLKSASIALRPSLTNRAPLMAEQRICFSRDISEHADGEYREACDDAEDCITMDLAPSCQYRYFRILTFRDPVLAPRHLLSARSEKKKSHSGSEGAWLTKRCAPYDYVELQTRGTYAHVRACVHVL